MATTRAEDNFTDVATTPLASHTMDVGSGWTESQGTWQIASGGTAVILATSAGDGNDHATYDPGSPAVDFVRAEIITGASGTHRQGIVFNYQDDDNFWLFCGESDTGKWVLYEVSGGTYTSRAESTGQTINHSTTYTISAALSVNLSGDDAIVCLVNGSLKAAYAVASRPLVGETTIGIYQKGSVDTLGVFTSFLATKESPGITAARGQFTLTGIAAGLRAARSLTAGRGEFLILSNASGPRHGRLATADEGEFLLTGQDTGLRITRRLDCERGVFTFTGRDAALSIPTASVIGAGDATFTLTGYDTGLLASRRIAADRGQFSVMGQAVELPVTRIAERGAFVLTGHMATLSRTWKLTAERGAFFFSFPETRIGKSVPAVVGGSTSRVVIAGGSAASVSIATSNPSIG